MVSMVQINMRVNAEFQEAIERYRNRREKVLRETIPDFRFTTAEALRTLILNGLRSDEESAKKSVKF